MDGDTTPRGWAGASPSSTQGLLALGQGSFPRDRAWPRNQLAPGTEWCCKPHPGYPRLASPAEILISRQPHSFEGVYGFSVFPLSQAKIAPFKGATGPRVAGALPAAPLQNIASFTGKAPLPCLALFFLLTPQFSDGVKLQLTPSPIHACLPENTMYFHQQVIHLCLELVCLSLSCRFLLSSILTPQLPDSPPKPLINGKNLSRKGRRSKSPYIFSQ